MVEWGQGRWANGLVLWIQAGMWFNIVNVSLTFTMWSRVIFSVPSGGYVSCQPNGQHCVLGWNLPSPPHLALFFHFRAFIQVAYCDLNSARVNECQFYGLLEVSNGCQSQNGVVYLATALTSHDQISCFVIFVYTTKKMQSCLVEITLKGHREEMMKLCWPHR